MEATELQVVGVEGVVEFNPEVAIIQIAIKTKRTVQELLAKTAEVTTRFSVAQDVINELLRHSCSRSYSCSTNRSTVVGP